MTLPIYRGLSANDLDELIYFAIDNDICSYTDGDPESETSKQAERIYSAFLEIEEEVADEENTDE